MPQTKNSQSNFFQVSNFLYRDYGTLIGANGVVLYQALSRTHNSNTHTYQWSHRILTEKTGMSSDTITRTMRKLITAGLVKKTQSKTWVLGLQPKTNTGNFFKIPNQIYDDFGAMVGVSALVVYGCLVMCAGQGLKVAIRQKVIANMCHIHRDTVISSIKKLLEYKLISCEKSKNSIKHYVINDLMFSFPQKPTTESRKNRQQKAAKTDMGYRKNRHGVPQKPTATTRKNRQPSDKNNLNNQLLLQDKSRVGIELENTICKRLFKNTILKNVKCEKKNIHEGEKYEKQKPLTITNPKVLEVISYFTSLVNVNSNELGDVSKVESQLDNGYSVDDLVMVAKFCFDTWTNGSRAYLFPNTVFGKNFQNYLAAAKSAKRHEVTQEVTEKSEQGELKKQVVRDEFEILRQELLSNVNYGN